MGYSTRRDHSTDNGEVTTSVYSKNTVRTDDGVILKAGVLVMPRSPSGPAVAIIGQVQTVKPDGTVNVRWFRPEDNTPDLDAGTVAVDSFNERIAPAGLLALTPQRARVRE